MNIVRRITTTTTNNGATMKQYVTAEELVTNLTALTHGTAMVTVELDSPMDGKGKMLKTGNPFLGMGIVKRETLNGTIGYIYANAVNRIANKEGKEEREAKQHPWGDMDAKHLFRIHRKNGNPYLSMQVKNVAVHGFFKPDETMVNEDEIRTFIPEKNKSSTQADLDVEVIARDYDVRNIVSIKAFGIEYCLVEHIATQEREVIATPETVNA